MAGSTSVANGRDCSTRSAGPPTEAVRTLPSRLLVTVRTCGPFLADASISSNSSPTHGLIGMSKQARARGASPEPVNSGTTLDTVLFDVDDTLFDYSRALRSGLRRVREIYPELRRRSLSEVCQFHSDRSSATRRRVILGALTREEGRALRFSALFEFCGSDPNPRIAKECAEIYREEYLKSRYPVAGAAALLRALRERGLTIGLVTNNTREEQEEKLEFIGVRRSIDFMLTSQEVRIQKPDPRIFARALERGDTTPGRSVMVGDSWDSDVVGATAAGIRAVWLNRANRESPDPLLAAELPSFRPMQRAMQCILSGSLPRGVERSARNALRAASPKKYRQDRNPR